MDVVLIDFLTHFPDHGAGSCCLLPQLNSIKLSIHRALSYEKFERLLASRCYEDHDCTSGGVVQICTAVLVCCELTSASGRPARYMPEDTYQKFKAVCESGLDFYIEFPLSLDSSESLTLEEYFGGAGEWARGGSGGWAGGRR